MAEDMRVPPDHMIILPTAASLAMSGRTPVGDCGSDDAIADQSPRLDHALALAAPREDTRKIVPLGSEIDSVLSGRIFPLVAYYAASANVMSFVLTSLRSNVKLSQSCPQP